MTDPLSIRIDPDVDARLSKSLCVKQAIEDQLEDLVDLYLAQRVTRRIAEGRARLIPLEELDRELGVDD